jgi:hypothetical protein
MTVLTVGVLRAWLSLLDDGTEVVLESGHNVTTEVWVSRKVPYAVIRRGGKRGL